MITATVVDGSGTDRRGHGLGLLDDRADRADLQCRRFDPGGAGTVYKLNRATGAVVRRINPFSDINTNRYTASPLTVDSAGNIFYNAIQLRAVSPWTIDPINSWLVRIDPKDASVHVVGKIDPPGYPTFVMGTASDGR